MHRRLRKIYLICLALAVVGFTVVYLLRQSNPSVVLPEQHMVIVAPAIFILAAVFAIAGPVLYRSIFADRQRACAEVPPAVLYRFERNLTAMSMMAPYLALAGYGLQLPRFHLAATLLTALYAVYYHYPSQRRIAFDMKIFRVGDGIAVEKKSPTRTDKISTI